MCFEAVKAVIERSQNTGAAHHLLLIIAYHINRDDGQWSLGIRELCDESRKKRSEVHALLAKLEKSGELIITHQRPRKSVFRITLYEPSMSRKSDIEMSRKSDIQSPENRTLTSGKPDIGSYKDHNLPQDDLQKGQSNGRTEPAGRAEHPAAARPAQPNAGGTRTYPPKPASRTLPNSKNDGPYAAFVKRSVERLDITRGFGAGIAIPDIADTSED